MNEESSNDDTFENKFLDDTIQPSVKTSSLPITAGVLLIIAGIITILHWIVMIASSDLIISLIDLDMYSSMNITITPDQLSTTLNTCGAMAIATSIFTVFGGVMSFQRKMIGLALVGGILGVITLAPMFLFIPNILSLIGLILVFVSRKEF